MVPLYFHGALMFQPHLRLKILPLWTITHTKYETGHQGPKISILRHQYCQRSPAYLGKSVQDLDVWNAKYGTLN